MKRPNKYHAKRTVVDGFGFDSKLEAKRYGELKLLQRSGQISELVVHPTFTVHINNIKVCTVELDFRYLDKQQVFHVEDVKGVDTALSKLKRKLVEAAYGLTVTLVR